MTHQTGRKSKRLLYFFLAVLMCALLALAYTYLIQPHLLSLPRASEIESINAEIFELNHEIRSFQVDSDYFSKILASLMPAHRDFFGTDWQGLGTITIKCNDGSMLFIDLYRTGQVKGAFSLRSERKYSSSIISNDFRGGTEANIERVLREAYIASKGPEK